MTSDPQTPGRIGPDEAARRCVAALIKYPIGSAWRHTKSGGLYVLKSHALRESDLEPLVTYKPDGHPDAVWCRTLAEFLERFTPWGPEPTRSS